MVSDNRQLRNFQSPLSGRIAGPMTGPTIVDCARSGRPAALAVTSESDAPQRQCNGRIGGDVQHGRSVEAHVPPQVLAGTGGKRLLLTNRPDTDHDAP
jgi:hypothetical protein